MVHHRAMALSTLTHSLMTVSVMSSERGMRFIRVTRARISLACRLILPVLSVNFWTRPLSTSTMALRSASRSVTHAFSIITLSSGDNSGLIRPASALERALAISSKRKQVSFFILLAKRMCKYSNCKTKMPFVNKCLQMPRHCGIFVI